MYVIYLECIYVLMILPENIFLTCLLLTRTYLDLGLYVRAIRSSKLVNSITSIPQYNLNHGGML